jgi:hypothetical protein
MNVTEDEQYIEQQYIEQQEDAAYDERQREYGDE